MNKMERKYGLNTSERLNSIIKKLIQNGYNELEINRYLMRNKEFICPKLEYKDYSLRIKNKMRRFYM